MKTVKKNDYLFEFMNFLIDKKRSEFDNDIQYKNNVIYYLGIAYSRLGDKLDYNEIKKLIEEISDVLYYAPQYVKSNLEAGLKAEYLNISYDKLKQVFNLTDKFIESFKNRSKKRRRIKKQTANKVRSIIEDKNLFNVKTSILAKIFKVSKSFIKSIKLEQKSKCLSASNDRNEVAEIIIASNFEKIKNNNNLSIFDTKFKEKVYSWTG